MDTEFKRRHAFFFGAFAAFLVLTAFLAFVDPMGQVRQIKAEAVSAGVAEWIVSYDSKGSPVLEFRWKTTNQVF